MKNVQLASLVFSMLLLSLAGCSSNQNPTVPQNIDNGSSLSATSNALTHSNRIVWGLWKISISKDLSSISVTPNRSAMMHFNMVNVLQNTPAGDYLHVQNVKHLDQNTIQADITLIHPYPYNKKLTGFDVRGIFISEADFTFPASGRKIAYGDTVPRLLNFDGYTELFNPTDFPETTPPMLGYIPGHHAPGGNLTSTLNPFVTYQTSEPRRAFLPGTVSTRTVQIRFPDGPLQFGYAVDASWTPVDGVMNDPVKDFPVSANCIEPYWLMSGVGSGLAASSYGKAKVQVVVYDHQGISGISGVSVEAPDIFSGSVELALSIPDNENYAIYQGTIYNEKGLNDGQYPMLIKAESCDSDANLGEISAWNVVTVNVANDRWTGIIKGLGGTQPFDVITDSAGNIYVTGFFWDKADFDPGLGEEWRTATHYPKYTDPCDVYLLSLDPKGNFRWVQTWGGASNNLCDIGITLARDIHGNILVGSWTRSYGFVGPFQVPTAPANTDLVCPIVAFDSAGNVAYDPINIFGSFVRIERCGIDGSGNIYACGQFEYKIDFSPAAGDEFIIPTVDSFLVKYSPSGIYLWSHFWGPDEWGPDGWAYGMATDMAVDTTGNTYVTGVFSGTVDFDTGPGENIQISSGPDKYLCKNSSDGEFQWAQTWDGAFDIPFVPYTLEGRSQDSRVALGPDPWVYVGGDQKIGPNKYSYVMLFTTSGCCEKTVTFGSKYDNESHALMADEKGDLYITGNVNAGPLVDMDPGSGTFWLDPQSGNSYILKLNSVLDFQWVANFGWPGYAWTCSLDIGKDSHITACGFYEDKCDLDPGPGIEMFPDLNGNVGFIMHFKP